MYYDNNILMFKVLKRFNTSIVSILSYLYTRMLALLSYRALSYNISLIVVTSIYLAMPEKCILLEDAVAQKQTSNKWNPLATKSFFGEWLPRGYLLVELTDVEARKTQQHFTPPLNYKKFSDDSVKLYCKPEQVLQLSDEQFSLLLGVKLPFNRYEVLNILPWVEKLKVGFGVDVTIPTNPYPVRGIIRYIGSLPGEEGAKFGIELLVSQ